MRIIDWSSDVCSSDLDHPHDLVVDLGVQGREGEVLELPLDGVHAEPVGQRGIDVEGLASLALLGLLLDVAQSSHVVQRSEERRGGKAGVSTCRSRWSPYHSNKHTYA